MNRSIFAEKIFYYEDLILDPQRLVSLIEETDETLTDSDAIEKWHKWVASGGGPEYVFGHQKFTDESKLSTSSENVAYIYETVKSALVSIGKDYSSELGIEYEEHAPISVSRYRTGGEMGPHVDHYGETHYTPLMSAVLYLNDDVEGGELNFPNQGITIKPKAGSAIVFPSVEPFLHESLQVTSGVKYIVPAFWVKRLVNY
jgi:hypothetical protein